MCSVCWAFNGYMDKFGYVGGSAPGPIMTMKHQESVFSSTYEARFHVTLCLECTIDDDMPVLRTECDIPDHTGV